MNNSVQRFKVNFYSFILVFQRRPPASPWSGYFVSGEFKGVDDGPLTLSPMTVPHYKNYS